MGATEPAGSARPGNHASCDVNSELRQLFNLPALLEGLKFQPKFLTETLSNWVVVCARVELIRRAVISSCRYGRLFILHRAGSFWAAH